MAARRTASRRWVAGAAAVLVAAGTAVIAAPAASAAPVAVTGGTIDWGIRASFRNYINGPIAHGSITTAAGATQAAGNGIFTFPVSAGSRDTVAGTTDATSGGSVHFLGHGGILDVLVSDVRIDIDGSTGFVVADVVSKEFIDTTTSGPPVTYDDIQLVELDLTGVTPTTGTNTVTYTNVPTELTVAGAPAFGDFYPAGDAFDAMSFTLQLEEEEEPEPEPEPAPTGNLIWKISQQAWTSSSLAPGHTAVAPATKDAVNGFVFPVTDVEHDPATGATDLRFGGSVLIGSTPAQGDYRVGFADLHIIVDATGAGRLEADPSYCVGVSGTPPCTYTTGDDLTIFTFQADGDDVDDYGGYVEAAYTAAPWAFTGPFPNTVDAFDQELITFLPASLQAHFRATAATGSNLNKPPAPLVVSFDYPVGDGVDITTTVAPGGLTISIASDEVVLPTPTLNSAGTALETDGTLGAVTVTDTRATNPGWNVTAQLTDFTGTAGTLDGDGLGWSPSVTSTSAGQSVTAGPTVAPGTGLTGAELAEAAAGSGLGTAVLGAGLDLELPTNTPPGTYTATLTLTAI